MKLIKQISIVNLLRHMLFNIYLIFITLFMITDMDALRLISIASGIILLMIEIRKLYKKSLYVYIIFVLVLLGFLLNILVTSNPGGIKLLTLLIANIGLTLFLIQQRLNPNITVVFFTSVIVFFSFHIFAMTDTNEILVSHSRNYISVIAIFWVCLVYISYYQNKKEISTLPALITFIIALWAAGRSGIAASAFLLIGVFFLAIKNKWNYPLMGLVILTIIIIINTSPTLSFEQFSLASFENKSLDNEPRFDILHRYFNNIDLKSFFFGFDWADRFRLSGFSSGNLHNSYLYAHFSLGFMAIILAFMFIMACCKAFIQNKLFLILLVSIWFRATTDTFLILGNFDFIFFYLISYTLSSKSMADVKCDTNSEINKVRGLNI